MCGLKSNAVSLLFSGFQQCNAAPKLKLSMRSGQSQQTQTAHVTKPRAGKRARASHDSFKFGFPYNWLN